jgi:hydrogenase maturation protease
VALAAQEIAAWGFAGRARGADEVVLPLNATPLALAEYESGRPTDAEACRAGDPRLLERLAKSADRDPTPARDATPLASEPR